MILGEQEKAMRELWPFLRQESDLAEEIRKHAESLADLMERETFYKEFPAIDQHTKALEEEYQRRHQEALQARAKAYASALEQLEGTPGWENLKEEQRQLIIDPLAQPCYHEPGPSHPRAVT